MLKILLINIIICIVTAVAIGLWCDYRACIHAERAVVEQENRELEYWRERLVPLYRSMGIEHKDSPSTKAEVFDPLIKSLESR